jgi:flagellar biosynthesis/type III secretory pathway M-ring protein FliF/YscJ
MAEGITPAPSGGRQIIIIATVIAVVFFTIFIIGIRYSSKIMPDQGIPQIKLPANVVIYSNMELKDAALVIVRLKELKIPYQIKDEGRSISVPRARSDEARLGLAEKNLPAGGTVGWEIFDQSKLGATDFDRRIQFIRAISGELSRTINRISAIDDARVQIVIPETKLFEVSQAPVTGSVLLKLRPGETLSPKQVNGITYLVSRSVENLKLGNIAIIDTNGNILSGAENGPAVREGVSAAPKEENPEMVVEKSDEKEALGIQAKLDLENMLTNKVQSLLNKIYPPNITIARANVDSIQTKKTTVIILVDKKFKMDPAVKKTTFDTISAVIGYDKARGDKIIMKSVPFRSTGITGASNKAGINSADLFSLSTLKTIYRKYGRESAIAIVVLFVLVVFSAFGLFGGGKKEMPVEEVRPEPLQEENEAEIPIVNQMKDLASRNPKFAADVIRSWIGEGA